MTRSDAGLRASNASQRLTSSFTRTGVSVASGAARVGLLPRAIGYGEALAPLPAATPRAARNRVSYARGDVREWYANGPLGLEQGFTIARPPGGAGAARAADAPLTLSLAVSGNARATLAKDATSVAFLRDGKPALRYTGLTVTDASGRTLPSWLALSPDGRRLSIRVHARDARFPLRIDPFVQDGGKLAFGEGTASNRFGWSVAVSADGTTAIVGAPRNESLRGAAWVFTRSGTTWTQQGGKLTPAPAAREEGQIGETREGEFGASVALSANGDAALIGAPGDLEEEGAAWFFARSGSTWSQQGNPVLPGLGSGGGEAGAFESAESLFGSSVALSADGTTALVGAPGAYGSEGAVFPYRHTGKSWQSDGELTPDNEAGTFQSEAGASVALSGDGTTALVGGPRDGEAPTLAGAAWVYTRSGEAWTQGAKLTPAGASGSASMGASATLSADGATALLGGPHDDGGAGAVWAFARSGETWTQQGPKLLASGETGAGELGRAVALSGAGDEALLAAPNDSSHAGAVWRFARTGEEWTQSERIAVGGLSGLGEFGRGLALSADASTALVGEPLGGGSVRAFLESSMPALVSGPASAIERTSATLGATVDPNGEEVTSCRFEYGTTAAYGASVPCGSPPGSGTSPVAAAAAITGLTPGTTYHFRIVATNASGTNVGEDATLFTLPEPPTVVTGAASAVTTVSVKLNGTVDPNRGKVTSCEFEYGTTTSYGASVPCGVLPPQNEAVQPESATIGGLTEGATYHFRIVATSAGGTSFGSDREFTALSGPPEFGVCERVAAGAGHYGNSGCTSTKGKADYEWNATTVIGQSFTTKLTSGTIKLATASKSRTVTCTGESGTGEYTSSKTVGATRLTFTGCARGAEKCASAGAASGEVATDALEGALGVEANGATTAKDKLALDLYPLGRSGPFAEFTCGTAPAVTIGGSVIVALKADKMEATQSLKYKAPGGAQTPESFVEGERDVLEESIGGGPFEALGLTAKLTLTSAGEVEANSVV